jgi:hypothetical protein
MKKNKLVTLALLACTLLLFLPGAIKAQSDKEKMLNDSKKAKAAFIKSDPSMSGLFNTSYGYVIFPNIGNHCGGRTGGGGCIRDEAAGLPDGTDNCGAQVGGQAYRGIFFESKEAMDRFKENKLEFSGQVSAVAAKSGAAANVKYREGVAVFSEEIGGLMAEASLGGQKFTYEAYK